MTRRLARATTRELMERSMPRRYAVIAIIGAAGLITVAIFLYLPRPTQSAASSSGPLEAVAAVNSPFLNTRSDVQYVGSDACAACHRGQVDSYRHTGMGRSMAAIDLAVEPPDGAFDHSLSGRRYEVVRRNGQMWHRELLLSDANEIVLAEYPVAWVVGSGRHSRSYFIEAEGFLVESPITWYTSQQAWGMSPGFNRPEQLGFERAAGQGCLVCHAGRSHAVGKSLHRMQVEEASIGCERCHGPGSLHLAAHKEPPTGDETEIDHTIVNPAHLSRALSEAICQQCHLRGHATIVGRGHTADDFRPGLLLERFVQNYRLNVPDRPMTVVGHVEQLHLSRCYQNSGTLTCLTCHDPHDEDTSGLRLGARQNAKCATCHQPSACPQVKSAEDASCIRCHMPRSDTEIPHLAFTHHRIGIHNQPDAPTDEPERMPQGSGELAPIGDVSILSTVEQQRSLGLAYLETGNRQADANIGRLFQQKALSLLLEVRDANAHDGVLNAALSRLSYDLQTGQAETFAEAALTDSALAGQDRCNVLFLLSDAAIRRHRYADALPFAKELVTLRRHPVDWLMLADCERATGDLNIDALETAVRINPRLTNVHRFLAGHHRQTGDVDKARWHELRTK